MAKSRGLLPDAGRDLECPATSTEPAGTVECCAGVVCTAGFSNTEPDGYSYTRGFSSEPGAERARHHTGRECGNEFRGLVESVDHHPEHCESVGARWCGTLRRRFDGKGQAMRVQHAVAAPEIPLYQSGDLTPRRPPRRRMQHTIVAPETPIYQLGYLGVEASQVVGASAAPAGAATTAALTAAAAGSGAAYGAWAGPIGAGVGAVIGIIAGLLGKHALRAKQARNENSAVNIGVSGFDSDLRQIQQAFKSGQISAQDAIQAIEQTAMPGYWTVVTPQIQPGRNGCNSGSSCPPDTSAQGVQPCHGNIGAACCVGCYQLEPSITGPSGVLAALSGQSQSKGGPYTADIHIVAGSSYGASTRGAYTLDFTPPVAPASSISSGLTSLFSPSSGAPGGGTSLLPLLLIASLAWMTIR